MAEFDSDSPEDRLIHEAEELMRQKRFQDAASRYQDLRKFSPTDLWASLGYASALECAGKTNEAEQILEEATVRHRRSAPLYRFRHLFFVRREDLNRSSLSQDALDAELVEEGPEDQLADLYFNQGRYHEAHAELERLVRDGLLEDQEMKASVLARIGACQRQNGEFDIARERLLEALSLDPGHHWILSELAEVERGTGNIPAARRRYLEALEANPDDHWCRGHLAQMECEDGKIDRAVELYRQILAELPKATWAKVELSQVLTEKDPTQATALCMSALDDDPTFPWAHAQLANLSRRANKLDEARNHYRQALLTSPNAAWILHELADVCRHLGRMEEAYAHLEHARNIDLYDATTYGYFADLLRHEGKSVQAIANLEKAVELDDGYSWAWRELAELRALAGNYDAAEVAFQKAVELEPDEAINDGLKAFMLRCAGRRDASMPYLERAVERQADYLWAWREQIDYHLSRQRPDDAERVAKLAIQAMPDSSALFGMLAEALRRQGKRGEAMSQIAKALELAPEAPQLWAIRAELSAEDDDHVNALAYAEKAVHLDDGDEYHALLAQILIACNKLEEASGIVKRLMSEDKPIQPAYELSSLLAERLNDLDQAKAVCDKALAGPYADDVRLLLRRVRLGLQTQETAVTAHLLPLFDNPTLMPWREISQLFAQAGEQTMARRAAYIFLSSSACQGEDKAKGWLNLAELELMFGNTAESTSALNHALAIDRDCVPAQILGAVLADQRGDLPLAIRHLEHIDSQLHDRSPSDDDGPTESALLLRQLASLHERCNKPDEAAKCWRRIRAEVGNQPSYLADHAIFLLRQGQREEAEALVSIVMAEPSAESADQQRLLRELAITAANQQGPEAAIEVLLVYEQRLATSNRLLIAQLALNRGNHALAQKQLDLAMRQEPDNRAVHILRTRALIAAHDLVAAENLARTLCEQTPADEESASLFGECLAMRHKFQEALSALDHKSLPSRPSLERGLLTAVIQLETHGESHCLVSLGRLTNRDHQVPLVRLFAAAWPGAWARPDPTRLARVDDLFSIPPFVNVARRMAKAFARHGRYDLAAAMVLNVAQVTRNDADQDPQVARQLGALAVPWLCRLGRRREALAEALRSRSIAAVLRCLLP